MMMIHIADRRPLANYRFFDDFLTFANLKQAGNLGNMSDGVFDIMAFHDVIYFVDLIILIALCVKLPELKASQLKKRWAATVVIGGVGPQILDDIISVKCSCQKLRTVCLSNCKVDEKQRHSADNDSCSPSFFQLCRLQFRQLHTCEAA